MNIIEALAVVSPELMLVYLKAKDSDVARAALMTARNIARDRLLAMEGLRDTIGPHTAEMVRLEVAWAKLSQALEEEVEA